MFAYCRNNPIKCKDASGTDDICVTANEDNNNFNDHGPVSGSGGAGGGGTVTVYRAMSVSEYESTVSSSQFSAGPNSYESGKYFATTYDHATQWGNKLYPNGDYRILEVQFNSYILKSADTMYWSSLDGIGPAYFFSISSANLHMVCIC